MSYLKSVFGHLKQRSKVGLACVGDRRDGSHILDVVFVHGLRGDARDTWRSQGETSWLNWIDEDLSENVQVWSLSWPADAFNWRSDSRGMSIIERAANVLQVLRSSRIGERKLIFVCHSLGGILAKQILNSAATLNVNEWKKISDQTQGLVFLATPHSGSLWANVVSLVGGTTPNVVALNSGNDHVRHLALWYRNNAIQLGYKTLAFYETFPTRKIIVVDKASADPGTGDELVPIDADHFSIAKPTSRDHLLYSSLKLFIKSLVSTHSTKMPRQVKAFREFYEGSRIAPKIFGGRSSELALLSGWLKNDGSRNKLLITAPAGQGKSSLLVHWLAQLEAIQDGQVWRAVFVPVSIRFETNRPSVFYKLVADQLATILGIELRHVASTNIEEYYADSIGDMIDKLEQRVSRVIIIIDGLDEALDGRFDASVFSKASNYVRVLISARLVKGDVDGDGWLARLNWLKPDVEVLQLGPIDRKGLNEIVFANGLKESPLGSSEVDRLHELTRGDPLLISLYIEELTQSGETISASILNKLQPGFGPYFR